MALQPDPLGGNGLAIVLGGTTGNDVIAVSDSLPGHVLPAGSIVATVISPSVLVSPSGVSGTVAIFVGIVSPTPSGYETTCTLTIGGVEIDVETDQFSTPAWPITRIVAYGQAGNDIIGLDPRMAIAALLEGDAGADLLSGARGSDVLLGGADNDILSGDAGRDLLVGGEGADILLGDDGDDLLIAGWLSYERQSDKNEALSKIMAEWNSRRSYNQRIGNLRGTASGPAFDNRSNGEFYLRADGPSKNVFDDRVRDMLYGSDDKDWFFADLDNTSSSKRDLILNLTSGELCDDVD
jgi:Ca2+-binding RTX toxin-like protein